MLGSFVLATSASAQSDAENTYVKVVIGAITVVGLVILVAVFKLGKFIARKIRPNTPIGLQRAAGGALLLASFLLIAGLGK